MLQVKIYGSLSYSYLPCLSNLDFCNFRSNRACRYPCVPILPLTPGAAGIASNGKTPLRWTKLPEGDNDAGRLVSACPCLLRFRQSYKGAGQLIRCRHMSLRAQALRFKLLFRRRCPVGVQTRNGQQRLANSITSTPLQRIRSYDSRTEDNKRVPKHQ